MVRFGSLADISATYGHVRFTPKRTFGRAFCMSAISQSSSSSLACIDCGTICRPPYSSGKAEEAPNEHEGSLPDKSSRISRSGSQ